MLTHFFSGRKMLFFRPFYAVPVESVADAGVQNLADVPQVRDLLRGGQTRVTLPKSLRGDAGSIAVRGVSAYGAQGPAAAARR